LFDKTFSVDRDRIRPLWFSVQIPGDIPPGDYTGTVTVAPTDLAERAVTLSLKVVEEVVQDAGDGEPRKHSRLRWLDSKITLDDLPCAPFVLIEVDGNRVSFRRRAFLLRDVPKYFDP